MIIDRWTGWRWAGWLAALTLVVPTLSVATTAHAGDAPDPRVTAPALQFSGRMAVFVGRTLFARVNEAPIVAKASWALTPVPILTAGGEAPHTDEPNALMLTDQSLDLTVWARPVDLATVVTTTVRLASTPKAIASAPPEDAPGVVIHAGAPVEVTEKRGSAAKIQLLDADVQASGWVPVAALDTIYTPTYKARDLTDDIVLKSGARLLDKPGGALLLTLRWSPEDTAAQMMMAFNGVEGVRLRTMKILERGGYTLVTSEGRNWSVTGWVVNRQIDRTDSRTLSGFISGGSCGPNRIEVPAGTSLLQAAHGMAFGTTKVRDTIFVKEVVDGHASIDLDTAIGSLQAWIEVTGAVQLHPETNCEYDPAAADQSPGGGGDGKRAGYHGPLPAPTLGQPTVGPGLPPAMVRRYLKRNFDKLTACYDRELLTKPTRERTVLAKFTITADGHVTNARAEGAGPAEHCMSEVLLKIEFPKPKDSAAVDISCPVIFSPPP